MKRAPVVRVKKPYHPPKLIVYGDLTDLIRTSVVVYGQFDKVKVTTRS